MIEILATNDPVRLSFLRSVLNDAGIDFVILGDGLAAVLSSAIASRLMVDQADEAKALRIIGDAQRSSDGR